MKSAEAVYYRLVVGLLSTFLAIYCFSVLFYVATSADIGLRCLLTNDDPDSPGLQVRRVLINDFFASEELPAFFGEAPREGDLLLELGDQKIRTFNDYAQAMKKLRTAWRKPGSFDSRVENENPIDIERIYMSLPPVIDYYSAQAAERKYVRIKYKQLATGKTVPCWLGIHSVSSLDVALSILWCLLEFAIFAVAALSFYNRPTDHAARLFFALSFFTLPAFVGGYYWWVISESPFLLIPFLYCAILLPVVTLHFFLNYPSRHFVSDRYPYLTLAGLYFVPVLMLTLMTVLVSLVYFSGDAGESVQLTRSALSWVRYAVDVYIMISCLYFASTVYFVIENYRKCTQPSEQKQLQWILIASLLAVPLVFYTVYLSFGDRVGLALGKGRIPMVVVSLLFMTAYAIGIFRHRLMLLDQIVSKHMLYLLMSQSVTVVYSLLIAVGSLLTVYRGASVPEQLLPFAFFLTVIILAMGWVKDRVQSAIDRRFFREKYRLDRAMHQMNSVVAKVADVRSLAEHMLRSCREVLQVRYSALYLRDGRTHQYELVASVGGTNLPGAFQLDAESEEQLQQAGSYQRIASSSKQHSSHLQQLHREFNSHLMHGFEVDGQLSGIVLLGAKASSSPFSAEDVTFVATIGQMTSVALQCVRVQQNVSRLDVILQEKVRKIDSQQRQIAILQRQVAGKSVESETVPSPTLLRDQPDFDRGAICGSSPAIIQLINSARKVSESDSSVLLRGESGTGKELFARAIHMNSKRRGSPLVCVNCAALSSSLLESELFGHVKGAFTGAYKDVIGRFQMADGGTLFLDEIGDVPADVQVKLLRVLQERQFEPVGSRESVSVDVRLITATHQNLEELIEQGRFREDLYYRLNVITLRLPPLRERKEDIFELSLEFLSEATRQAGKQISEIDDLAFRALLNYDWPGNIRELQNAIHRAVVLAETDCILLENLPLEVQQSGTESIAIALESQAKPVQEKRTPVSQRSQVVSPPPNQKETVAASGVDERELLLEALQASSGNKSQAARMLDMPRSTFYSKMKKYGLDDL